MGERVKIKSVDEGITGKKQLPINLMMKNRLGAKWILIILLCVVFGGVSGVLVNNYLFPYFLTLPQFEKYKFLKSKDKSILIKKETLKIEEENIIPEIAKKIKPYFVSIAESNELENYFGRVETLKNKGIGVILTSDGLIATSKQVAPKQAFYTVVTSDGKNYKTNKIYYDPSSDLVFLKIKANRLQTSDLVNDDDILVGQKVLTLKDLLLSYEFDSVSGTVNNLNKISNFKPNSENLDSFILAKMDEGEGLLGSPIFNLSGKMIGMVVDKNKNNVFIMTSQDIKKPLSYVIKDEKIKRTKLGIKYLIVTQDFAEFKNLKRNKGIYLPLNPAFDSVAKNSLAQKAGLKPGDIIYAINGKEINERDSYFRIMQQMNFGDEIEISYLRNDEEYKTKIVVKE